MCHATMQVEKAGLKIATHNRWERTPLMDELEVGCTRVCPCCMKSCMPRHMEREGTCASFGLAGPCTCTGAQMHGAAASVRMRSVCLGAVNAWVRPPC